MNRALLRPLLVATSALVALPAVATDDLHLQVGYGFSGEYRRRNGDKVTTNGPTIGLSIPFATFLGTEIAFEPSAFFGGRFSHGSDSDADVYRFLVTLRHAIPGKLTALAGAGYAHSFDRAGQVDSAAGFVGRFGVAFGLDSFPFKVERPEVQATYMVGPSGQLTGFFLGLSVGF